MTLSPRESGEYISSLSTHVKIKEDGIERLADMVALKIEYEDFATLRLAQYKYYPHRNDPLALDWLLVAATLSFRLAPHDLDESNRWRVWSRKGPRLGYLGLCTALTRSLRDYPQFFDPFFYIHITEYDLFLILKGDSSIPAPLLVEKVRHLHEIGNILIERFGGSFKRFVERSNQSAEKLLHMLVSNFECFRDVAFYKGENVAFYKRAQLLIGNIWYFFKGKGIGRFTDIDKITLAASYRTPQVLFLFGALEYTEELMEKLRNGTALRYGEEEEVEIRGCSIHAIELLKNLISKRFPSENVNSIKLDRFLWHYRVANSRRIKERDIPFHITYSTHY